ncbi:hypothetical protein HBI54_168710 [Parastagonospora nodorum]|nr:hypothetical protein HBI54_168710 [Parastagonospora nodorum]
MYIPLLVNDSCSANQCLRQSQKPSHLDTLNTAVGVFEETNPSNDFPQSILLLPQLSTPRHRAYPRARCRVCQQRRVPASPRRRLGQGTRSLVADEKKVPED